MHTARARHVPYTACACTIHCMYYTVKHCMYYTPHALYTACAPQLHAVYCLANCATTAAGLRALGGSTAPVLLARLAAGSDPTGVLETQARQAARTLHVLYTARTLHRTYFTPPVHCESR